MDRIELNNLFAIYEDLLTDKEKDIYKLYCYDDLSLQEISDNLSITRTAVYNTIKRVNDKLTFYEEKLHLYSIKESLKNINNLNDIDKIKKKINELI